MALVACHECGAKISSDTRKCPQCGAPSKLERVRGDILIVATLICVAVIGILVWLNV